MSLAPSHSEESTEVKFLPLTAILYFVVRHLRHFHICCCDRRINPIPAIDADQIGFHSDNKRETIVRLASVCQNTVVTHHFLFLLSIMELRPPSHHHLALPDTRASKPCITLHSQPLAPPATGIVSCEWWWTGWGCSGLGVQL
jgi:hypothetical protein